ncbi:MAG: DUF6318 family protein, partial [Micrococcaceae bacterium]|nr:DUF6318 family protein [Micrococcaceae bacterium]
MFAKLKSVIGILCASTLMLVAAGCTSNPDPTVTSSSPLGPTTTLSSSPPTPPPTPSVKPTPKPVPASSKGPAKNWPVPKMPDAAKEKSENGLKAFVKFYYELVEYTIETNNSKPLRAFTDPACNACFEEFIDTADGNKVAGSWITGVDLRPTVTKTVIDGKSGVALITITQGEMLTYASDGTQYATFPAVEVPLPGTMLLLYKS